MAEKQPIGGYIASIPLACVGTALFGALALIFWLRFFIHGRHRYMLILCISTTTMCTGFIIRIPLHSNPTQLGIYIVTTLFTLLSPCGFMALDYVLLPRLASYLDAQDALFIRPRIIARIFVTSDIITFFTQAGGSGLTASQNSSTANLGHWIALGALIVQGISFGLFTIMAIVFGFRVRKSFGAEDKYIDMVQRSSANGQQSDKRSLSKVQQQSTSPLAPVPKEWKILYSAIMWTTVGILIRCVYRIIEYTQGYHGYIPTTEAFFYCLDSLPLFLAISVWTIIWPPRYLGDRPASRMKNNSSHSSTA